MSVVHVGVLESGGASVNLDQSFVIDARCTYRLTLQLIASDSNGDSSNASSSVMIDSVVLIPDYRLSTAYRNTGTPE